MTFIDKAVPKSASGKILHRMLVDNVHSLWVVPTRFRTRVKASTISISMPPAGCKCHDISALTSTSAAALSSSSSCKTFDCGCSCDMTGSVCDAIPTVLKTII